MLSVECLVIYYHLRSTLRVWFQNVRFMFQNVRLAFQKVRFATPHVMFGQLGWHVLLMR
jgi:hypothetical protein